MKQFRIGQQLCFLAHDGKADDTQSAFNSQTPHHITLCLGGISLQLGSGWGGGLLAPVPVTQCGEQEDAGQPGQSASDKKNAVPVDEAV